MIGERFPSEMRTFRDPVSGLDVTQLTGSGINVHMYFTDNAFDLSGERIYILSNRAAGGRGEILNIFSLDLESGEMTQMTDEKDGIVIDAFTKTPDSEYIGYIVRENTVRILNTKTGELRTIYHNPDMVLHNLSFSCDKKTVGFVCDEKLDGLIPNGGANYAGFRDKMFALKKGVVARIGIDGSGYREMFRDTCWVNHFQFSPVDPCLAMFCHEGPWNEVLQRIWLIDMETGEVWPCFRQGPDDCVGHEFWLRNGDIVFDNRRGGHDGTISVTKEQVFAKGAAPSDLPPYFGFADRTGRVYKTVDMPYYCNHYMGNSRGDIFVGDTAEDIVMIRPEAEPEKRIRVLARHMTTWKYQRSHPHPTLSWDGKRCLFAADRSDDRDDLFIVDLPEEMQDAGPSEGHKENL